MDAIKNFTKDGVEYYSLYAACPNCVIAGHPAKPVFWKHDNCGGQMYVGDDAHVYCEKCKTKFPITNCQFECPDCTQYRREAVVKNKPNMNNVAGGIAILGGISIANLKWLNRLTSALIALDDSPNSSVQLKPENTIKTFIKDDVEYRQMYIVCPVCCSENRPNIPSRWKHATDNGDMYIGDNGYYYCEACGETFPIVEWAYECSDCKTTDCENAIRLVNVKHVAAAISTSGLVSDPDGMQWLNRLCRALEEQKEKCPTIDINKRIIKQ